MLTNISFGSTYKVNSKDNDYNEFSKFQQYVLNKVNTNEVKAHLEDNIDDMNGYFRLYNYRMNYTLIAPDYMDSDVETYCMKNGIKFKKYDHDKLMKPELILSRIKKPADNMVLAKVNSQKLEELAKNQNSNIEHCENNYDEYYFEKADYMLKSADEIPAATLYINSDSSSEDVIDYVKNFGAKTK